MKNKVLVVVDMQNDFITGSLGSEAAQAIVPAVVEKIRKAQKEDTAVILTKDTHFENYLETLEGKKLPVPHCLLNTWGHEICDQIKAVLDPSDSFIMQKLTFGDLELADIVNECCELPGGWDDALTSIEICGLCTDICVIANAVVLRTAYPNTPIIVDSKACAGTSQEAHDAALTVMKSLQIDVI